MASFDQVVSWLADGDGVFQQQVRDCGADFEQRIFRPSDVGSPAAIQLGGEAFYRMQSVRESIRTSRLALHPGSGSPRKNWPAASWVETLNALHQEGQADEILLVCGEAEMPALAEITGALRLPFKMALNLPLPELAHELAACRWFLGHDSGPAHLAAACGVPCALVFGPANPAVWAPQAPHVHWLKLTSPVEPGVPTVREWLSHLLATPCSALDASGV